MAEDRQFGSEYVQARRILLGSSSLLLLISLPGIRLEKVPIIGMELSGVTAGYFIVGLAIACSYFLIQFLFHLFEETSIYKNVRSLEDNALRLLPGAVRAHEDYARTLDELYRKYADFEAFSHASAAINEAGVIVSLQELKEAFVESLSQRSTDRLSLIYNQPRRAGRQIDSPEYARAGEFFTLVQKEVSLSFDDVMAGALAKALRTGEGIVWNASDLTTLSKIAKGQIRANRDEVSKAADTLQTIARYLRNQQRWRKGRVLGLELTVPCLLFVIAMMHAAWHIGWRWGPAITQPLNGFVR